MTQQQRTGTEQVSQSLEQVGAILARSVAATQQTRAASKDLSERAAVLMQAMGRFQIQ